MTDEVKNAVSKPGERMTENELMVRLKVFIGVCLALTLFGIVFVVLYSLIFVTQPLNAISPIDQKFFELIIPIATFLTGTLSGIMLAGNNKEAQMKALEAATREVKVSSAPSSIQSSPSVSGFNASYSPSSGLNMSYKTPSTTSAPVPSSSVSNSAAPASSTKPMPAVAKPPSTGPIDDDDMPERDD